MSPERAERAARAVAGAAPLELLRRGEGSVFRAAGVGIVRVTDPRRRPLAEVARELETAQALVYEGAPVARPLRGPLEAEGLVVCLWQDLPDTGARDARAFAAMGAALAALHNVGSRLLLEGRIDAPDWRPLDWLATRLDRAGGAIDTGVRRRLEALAGEAAAALVGPATLLHTDAHAANFRLGEDRHAALVDLEQLHVGPWKYDLAAMEVTQRRLHGDREGFAHFLDGFGAGVAPDDPELAALIRLRELLSIGFVAGLAARDPAAGEAAAARLRDVESGSQALWRPW